MAGKKEKGKREDGKRERGEKGEKRGRVMVKFTRLTHRYALTVYTKHDSEGRSEVRMPGVLKFMRLTSKPTL